jgi:hypothetical protein
VWCVAGTSYARQADARLADVRLADIRQDYVIVYVHVCACVYKGDLRVTHVVRTISECVNVLACWCVIAIIVHRRVAGYGYVDYVDARRHAAIHVFLYCSAIKHRRRYQRPVGFDYTYMHPRHCGHHAGRAPQQW